MAAKNIYMEFDALYDTRLGAVASIDDMAAEELIKSEDYKLRISDEFSYILKNWDDKAFNEEYQKRDILTLILSPMTELLMQLREVLDELRKSVAVLTPDSEERPVIFLNHWPFHDLTEYEKEQFVNSIRTVAGGWFEYELIYVEPKDLTLRWFEVNQVSVGFIYDFTIFDANCLNGIDTNNIPKIPYTHLTFARRVLNRAKLKDLVEYKNGDGMSIDPFYAHTGFRAEYIGVRWKGMDLYSAANISLHLNQ